MAAFVRTPTRHLLRIKIRPIAGRISFLCTFGCMEQESIPKQYFTISEVADMLGVNTSVIRFWEQEFAEVRPRKNRKGNRIYMQRDIETLRKIHYLLKVQRFTIKGAQERLLTDNGHVEEEMKIRETLIKIRVFFGELLENL
jgi:DNA-binding transcriptional MerR regulator